MIFVEFMKIVHQHLVIEVLTHFNYVKHL